MLPSPFPSLPYQDTYGEDSTGQTHFGRRFLSHFFPSDVMLNINNSMTCESYFYLSARLW